MAPDTPPRRYADIPPDAFYSDRCNAEPRPPSERGWLPPTPAHLIGELLAVQSLNAALDRALEQTRQRRAADRTFENETRLH